MNIKCNSSRKISNNKIRSLSAFTNSMILLEYDKHNEEEIKMINFNKYQLLNESKSTLLDQFKILSKKNLVKNSSQHTLKSKFSHRLTKL